MIIMDIQLSRPKVVLEEEEEGCLEEAYSIIGLMHEAIQDYEEVDISAEDAQLIEKIFDSAMVLQEKLRPILKEND